MVGYQQNAVPTGYKMVTPTFVNVSGGEYNIDDLQVVGVDDTYADIQVMNSEGQWTGWYFWFNAYGDLPAGWFDDTGTTPADITLKPGDAVFFNTSVEGAKIQSAGQVPGAITNSVPVGYSMVGNASPVAINLDDLKVIGVDDTYADVQIMSADGQWTGWYFWFNEYGDLPSGWFDDTGTTPAEITLQPGDSVFFNTSVEGAKVVVPSAL